MDSKKTNDTSLNFKDILQKHFVFIVSSLAFSIGFLVMMSYTRDFPSNIFAELSPTDLLYIFGGGMVLTILLAIMPIIPYIPLIQKNAPNSDTELEQMPETHCCCFFSKLSFRFKTIKNPLENLAIGEKIFVIMSFLVFYILLYFLFASLISIFLNDSTTKLIPCLLAGVFIVFIAIMPVTFKGLILRSVTVVITFIFLAGNKTPNVIIKFSGLGNKPACLILTPESNMVVRGFTSITTENHQNMFFAKRPLWLVLQTREHLYLQERQAIKPIFQLKAKDNLLFSPTDKNACTMPNYSLEVLCNEKIYIIDYPSCNRL